MIDTVNCPSCGTNLSLKLEARGVINCPYCDNIFDVRQELEEIKKADIEKTIQPPKSALKLGREGNINGINYQIVGRIRYNDKSQNCWWDEWLLLSESGQYLWLQEENWDFVLMTKFTPREPVDPNSVTGEVMQIDTYKLSVEDNSEAEIEFFEGNLTWKASIGEKVKYIDAWKGEEILYSIEWTDKEIMFFIGKELPAEAIYAAFKLGNVPPEAESDEIILTPFQKWADKLIQGTYYKAASWFGMIFAITALVLGAFGIIVPTTGKDVADSGSKRVGPFYLGKPGTVYKIDTVVNGLSNRSVVLLYNFTDAKKRPCGDFDCEYWEENGQDEGVSWQEKSDRSTVYFRLEEAGTYFIDVAPEAKADTMPSVRVSIKEGVFDTKPLWFLSLALLAWPGIATFLWLLAHSIYREETDSY